MKIGLLSDVHATPKPVAEALRRFRSAGVDMILCAGDLAGYGSALEETLTLLREAGVRAVLGNHDLWWLEDAAERGEFTGPAADYLRALPPTFVLEVADTRLHMVHASPPSSLMNGITLRDRDGALMPTALAEWRARLAGLPCDVLVVGHTHQVFAETLGPVLVVNPGSTLFNHTAMILTLAEREVELLALSGREPRLTWNWAEYRHRL